MSSKLKQKSIPLNQFVAYGVGGIIPIALFNIAGQLMGLIGNISLGLSALWLGVILIIPRLWDAISDPIVGYISDNTKSRWGRRRPFLLIGGIAVAISFVLMWWIPDGKFIHSIFSSESSYQWFQLIYILFWLLIFFTACTVFEIPHGALGMEMTNDPHERTRLFSVKSFMGNLFAMATPWLFAVANMELFKGPGGNEADGMRYVSIMIAAVLIPLSFWWFKTVREPGYNKNKASEKRPFWKDFKHTSTNKTFIRLVLIIFTLAMGFNFVNLLGYYIPIFYIFGGDKVAASTILGLNGTVWAITGLLAVFPLNWISPKLGKRKTLLIAIFLMCAAQLSKIVCYNPAHPYLIVIPTVLLSAGMLFFFTLGSSMVGDICDEDDLKTGHRSEGSYYSIYWWFIKMGTALASFVAGALIMFVQFDEAQVTSIDTYKGSINELKVKTEQWESNTAQTQDFYIQQIESSITETNDFIDKLDIELIKIKSNTKSSDQEKANHFLELKSEMVQNVKSLNEHLNSISNAASHELLTASIKEQVLLMPISKIKHNDFLFEQHLIKQESEKEKIQEHYQQLTEKYKSVHKNVMNLNAGVTVQELNDLDMQIAPLMKQSSYTLIMMRVVEIALPLLLCLISVLLTMRYNLTEKRIQEIKEALTKRNSEQ